MSEIIQDIKGGDFSSFLDKINALLNYKLLMVGETNLTIGLFLGLTFSIILVFVISELARKFLANKILARYKLELGMRQSIATIFKYLLIIIGLVTILQNSNVDLSALGILAGAIGVGIGFGLQNITNNFISGLIILFERPIKVGDRIEVDDVYGDVVKISARSTIILTNDNIAIIVPNSQFIDNSVINWSYNDGNIRFNIPVGVSYKEDPEKIKKILLEVVERNSGVLKQPKPDVLFDKYNDSSIDFNLRVWTTEYTNRPSVLRSQLYYEIFRRFKEENVEIPFPQRDLHIRSGLHKIDND
ncbi:mechanosensitive ion channel family protein [Cyclobacterium amurskyense]|jgi:small-conductance mechanosensitive channel|uniref:MscS Mechanosensitive ion channel n=1 Tax=Cyclobacterium amurskyense TaxID=320787 RepID=A0A0H4PB03_9BACT|nr:mechanosensitive ion channel domain-containing protein [Cyclobacterium amurskyense]AKP50325.1 MscS Mechanosensitive ion channel [Cyclobacterium amurskyense]|tara:strand:+ start:6010 stop:6915 length:906 start_codon:yes stop_codon:yes gene_type:complete